LDRTGFIGKAMRVMGNKTNPDVVVEVIGYVPVTVRTADVPSIVVPRAAANIHPASTTGG
jgi:hypothetical protein